MGRVAGKVANEQEKKQHCTCLFSECLFLSFGCAERKGHVGAKTLAGCNLAAKVRPRRRRSRCRDRALLYIPLRSTIMVSMWSVCSCRAVICRAESSAPHRHRKLNCLHDKIFRAGPPALGKVASYWGDERCLINIWWGEPARN